MNLGQIHWDTLCLDESGQEKVANLYLAKTDIESYFSFIFETKKKQDQYNRKHVLKDFYSMRDTFIVSNSPNDLYIVKSANMVSVVAKQKMDSRRLSDLISEFHSSQ